MIFHDVRGGRTIPRHHRPLLAAALVVYALGVVAVLAWPTPVDASAAGPLRLATRWLAARGLGWVTYSVIEFTANVALFVPAGLLVALADRRLRWWHVVGGAATLSALAEIAQSVLRPERFGTVQDVVANTVGAALGFLTAWWLRASDPRTEAAREDSTPG